MRKLIVVVVAILLITMTFYMPSLLNRTFGIPPDPAGVEAIADAQPTAAWFGTPDDPDILPATRPPIIVPTATMTQRSIIRLPAAPSGVVVLPTPTP